MHNSTPRPTTNVGRTNRSSRIAACAFAAFAVAVGAACSDDDANTDTTTAPDGRETVNITLSDYAFEGVPQTLAAGTAINATNESTQEAHELVALLLPDNESRTLAELQALPPDQLGALLPDAPALVITAHPDDSGELVVGDGTLREPGRYLLVCFIPTGADPVEVMEATTAAAADPNAGPPQIDGGPPHLAAGMIAELVVTP